MKRGNGQFAKYLSRNLLIAAIVSSLLVPIYFVSLKSVRKNEVQSVYSDFETGFTQMDGTLEKLIDLSNLMVDNASISRLIHIDGEMQVRDYALLPQASSFVSSSIVSDDLVVNAYILSGKNDIFLSNSMVSEDRGKIYGTFYSIDGYDSQSWLKAVFKNRKGFFFLPDAVANWNFDVPERQKRHDTLHLVVPAPTAAGRSAQCAVVYMLNTEKLFEFFRSRNLSDKTFVYVADQSGNLIAGYRYRGRPLDLTGQVSSRKIDGTAYTLLRTESKKSGFSAVIGLDDRYFTTRVKDVRNMILIYTAAILLAAVAVSCFLAYRQYLPLKNLVSAARKIYPAGPDDEYEYISDTIRSLDGERQKFRREILSMDASIRGSLLERLLYGRIHTEADQKRCLEYFHFSERYFCVFLMKIASCPEGRDPMELSARARAAVVELIARETGCRVEFYNAEALRTDFVANFAAGAASPEALRSCLRKAVDEIGAGLGVQAVFGVGSVANGMKNVYASAWEARNSLRMADAAEPVRIPPEEGPEPARMIFDNNAGGKLYDLLLAGERNGVEDFFRSTARALEQRPPLTAPETCQVFYGIRSVVDGAERFLYRNAKTVALPVFSEDRNLKEQILSFLPICRELCDATAAMKTRRNKKLEADVVQYIRSAYRDGNLCALAVAEHFSVTEKSVYSAVKNLTGKSVCDFIEEVRFEEAEKLLRTSVSINKIPLMVGWNSTNTFYKAFKRVYGVSPGKWRESARQSERSGETL